MAIRERLSGNEAVAYAIKQINPDVMPAFPITPSTEIPQYVANYIANGEIDTEFIHVESEHSAMSATLGASAAGARALTATSSCGMALMWEELYVAASDRLPIVLALVNRALTGPININADHSDSMGARDSGWIQIYAESNQEVYDNFLQAFPIAEDPRVHLPVMICQDGFITSHGVENILLVEDDKVKELVGEYHPEHYLLNSREPLAVGPYAVSNYYMETKRAQREAMNTDLAQSHFFPGSPADLVYCRLTGACGGTDENDHVLRVLHGVLLKKSVMSARHLLKSGRQFQDHLPGIVHGLPLCSLGLHIIVGHPGP